MAIDKIEVNKELFIKYMIDKLYGINKKLTSLDTKLYENDEMEAEWQLARESSLEIEELIQFLE